MSPRWVSWLAALLCAIVVTDVLALMLRDTGRSGHHRLVRPPGALPAVPLPSAPSVGAPVPTPTPRVLVRYGRTFTVSAVPAEGARRDPSDPNRVDILATDAFTEDSADCLRQIRPSARLVTETDTYVVVATFAYRLPEPTGSASGCLFAASLPGTASVPVRLNEPLAGRTVWDVTSGKAIGIIAPADPPAPGFLPLGYHPQSAGGSDVPAVRSYVKGTTTLRVIVWSASNWHSSGDIIGSARVRGRPALVTDSGSDRCVDWADSPGRVYQVCASGQDGEPSDDQLVRIARSVR